MRKKDYNRIPFKNKAIDKITGPRGRKREVGFGGTPQGGDSKIVTVKGPRTSIKRETRLEPSGDVSFSLSKELKKKNRVKTKDVKISDGRGTITTVKKTGKGTVSRERNIKPAKAKRLQRRYTRRVNRMHMDGPPGPIQVSPPKGGGYTIPYKP